MRESAVRAQQAAALSSMLVLQGQQLSALQAAVLNNLGTPGGLAPCIQAGVPDNDAEAKRLVPRKKTSIRHAWQKASHRWQARIVLPNWISRCVWEISLSSSAGLRRFDLRSAYTHEESSVLFEYMAARTPTQLRRLLDVGSISADDDMGGFSLAEVCDADGLLHDIDRY